MENDLPEISFPRRGLRRIVDVFSRRIEVSNLYEVDY